MYKKEVINKIIIVPKFDLNGVVFNRPIYLLLLTFVRYFTKIKMFKNNNTNVTKDKRKKIKKFLMADAALDKPKSVRTAL